MQDPSPDLNPRLLALERRLKRTQAVAATALVAATLSGAAWWVERGATPPPAPAEQANSMDLQIHSVTLTDGAGQPRASWGVAADGAVALTLSAPDGTPRLVLQAHDQRSGLSALGPEGNRAWLGWGYSEERGDRAELQLLDRRGQPRVAVTASDAAPGLTFYNDAGVAAESVPP